MKAKDDNYSPSRKTLIIIIYLYVGIVDRFHESSVCVYPRSITNPYCFLFLNKNKPSQNNENLVHTYMMKKLLCMRVAAYHLLHIKLETTININK